MSGLGMRWGWLERVGWGLEPPGASWNPPEPSMSHLENFLMDHNCRRLLRPDVLKGSAEKEAAYTYIRIYIKYIRNFIRIS